MADYERQDYVSSIIDEVAGRLFDPALCSRAQSELIKLAITIATGRPVEMLQSVLARYGRTAPTSDRWFWRDAAPVRDLPPGRTLVIEDPRPFTLHFGFDEWNAVSERNAEQLGLGMFGVSLGSADLASHASVQFVRRYVDGQWEPASRHDVALHVTRAPALRLSAAELGRVTAAGVERVAQAIAQRVDGVVWEL